LNSKTIPYNLKDVTFYELSNHLGNVNVVLSDRKHAIDDDNDGAVDYYSPDILMTMDYYPFGQAIASRSTNSSSYKYGFQGQEMDDEVKGKGNSLAYKYRMHDPRIGRFFAIDPLSAKYPHYTPYSFSGNKVIYAIELEGLEEFIKIYHYDAETKRATFTKTVSNAEVKINSSSVFSINPLYPVPYFEKMDKRTGQRMSQEDIGMVQHQYYDSEGKRVVVSRNLDGEYVEGMENEIMTPGNNNYDGSIYIGKDNPSVIGEDGELRTDYRREPQDEADAAALLHDLGYDAVKAKGVNGALFNKCRVSQRY